MTTKNPAPTFHCSTCGTALWNRVTGCPLHPDAAAVRFIEPFCEDCRKPIPARDIRAYRDEAGDPAAIPAVCADCAELGAFRS